MGQLRDWWPSDDALIKKSSPAIANAHPSSPLQLSEAAAALNEDPKHFSLVSSTHIDPPSFSFLPCPSPQARPLSPMKLLNSQDHKQELLRNLLSLPLASACDLPSPSLSLQDDDLLNPRPLSFTGFLPSVDNNPSSFSAKDDISLGLFQKSTPSTSAPVSTFVKTHSLQEILCQPINESSSLERMASHRGTSHHSIKSKDPIVPEKTRSLHDVLHDSMNKDLERSHEVNKGLPSLEKTHGLHDIQHHPINKESLSRREIHIYSERQRRKGMTHLYTTLLALLPDGKPKTDRCKVLTDAMDYIHMLQEQVESLGCQKSELLQSRGEHQGEHHNTDYGSGADGEAVNSSTITVISDELKEEVLASADVAVRFCGRDVFVTLNSPKKKGLWSGILQILHEQEMEILSVTLSSGNELDHHCIHARLSTSSNSRSQQVVKMLQDLVLSYATLD